MKIIAYSALRYGRDYYDAAIRSVIDAVDEYYVLYATNPSHGHWSDVPCPETEDELRVIAEARAGSKLRWHRGTWTQEGQQRDSIHQYAPDADVILVLDADEVWQQALIDKVLRYAGTVTNSIPPFRNLRLAMVHYWRSLHRAVLHDPAFPVRVIFPRIDVHYGEQSWATRQGIINHFGYAQRPEIVQYKWKIHGHLNELRRDCDWFQDVFMNEDRRTDLHPVGSEFWNVEDINPWDYLPEYMKSHPYANLDIIR